MILIPNNSSNYRFVEKNDTLVLLSDFDGTLSPIVDHADNATFEPESGAAMAALAEKKRVRVAFISGRQINNLRKMINLKNVIYAGSHGLEIDFPDGFKFKYSIDPEVCKNFEVMVQDFKKNVSVSDFNICRCIMIKSNY